MQPRSALLRPRQAGHRWRTWRRTAHLWRPGRKPCSSTHRIRFHASEVPGWPYVGQPMWKRQPPLIRHLPASTACLPTVRGLCPDSPAISPLQRCPTCESSMPLQSMHSATCWPPGALLATRLVAELDISRSPSVERFEKSNPCGSHRVLVPDTAPGRGSSDTGWSAGRQRVLGTGCSWAGCLHRSSGRPVHTEPGLQPLTQFLGPPKQRVSGWR